MIRSEYPKNWQQISYVVRYVVYKGKCMFCDEEPDRKLLACIHLDHNNQNMEAWNLGSACCSCHAKYDAADISYKRKYGSKYYINQLRIEFDDDDEIFNGQRQAKANENLRRGRPLDPGTGQDQKSPGRSGNIRGIEPGKVIGHFKLAAQPLRYQSRGL